jgi:hypothetical protein
MCISLIYIHTHIYIYITHVCIYKFDAPTIKIERFRSGHGQITKQKIFYKRFYKHTNVRACANIRGRCAVRGRNGAVDHH